MPKLTSELTKEDIQKICEDSCLRCKNRGYFTGCKLRNYNELGIDTEVEV